MVAYLDRNHVALLKLAEQTALKGSRLLGNFSKRTELFPTGIEDRGSTISCPQRFSPGFEQRVRVVRFHPLRESRSAPKFGTRFQT